MRTHIRGVVSQTKRERDREREEKVQVGQQERVSQIKENGIGELKRRNRQYRRFLPCLRPKFQKSILEHQITITFLLLFSHHSLIFGQRPSSIISNSLGFKSHFSKSVPLKSSTHLGCGSAAFTSFSCPCASCLLYFYFSCCNSVSMCGPKISI